MEMWNDCQKSILFEAHFIGKNSRQKWNYILLMGRKLSDEWSKEIFIYWKSKH